MSRKPIGVFDSGLGGLTVVRQIRRQLPREPLIYFGDIARLPYGIKSTRQIREFSLQNTRFLLKQKVKAVVVACNSSSSAAYSALKHEFDIPIIDVIQPACAQALSVTRSGRLGVIGTDATIHSKVYVRTLKRAGGGLKIYSRACPLFVPLVEAGWFDDEVTREVIRRYLKPIKAKRIDTLILGCTHYPLLRKGIEEYMGPRVRIVDSAEPTVGKLASLLERNGLSYPGSGRGRLKVFTSDLPRNFIGIGSRFLGEKLRGVKVIRAW
ncbi:MAG: glutamate racemase [Candidatus Omnitrophota bacterium]|nr:glutamate racemase [Candidatus Omnitrophota bacterium]